MTVSNGYDVSFSKISNFGSFFKKKYSQVFRGFLPRFFLLHPYGVGLLNYDYSLLSRSFQNRRF